VLFSGRVQGKYKDCVKHFFVGEGGGGGGDEEDLLVYSTDEYKFRRRERYSIWRHICGVRKKMYEISFIEPGRAVVTCYRQNTRSCNLCRIFI